MCLPFSCFLRGTPGNPGLFRKISRVSRDFLIKKETALTDSLSLLFPGFTSAAQCQIPMRLLFETDYRSCSPGEEPISVPSVRAIIVSYGRVAMVRNAKDDYYRFPGGEIRSGETNISALAGRLPDGALPCPGPGRFRPVTGKPFPLLCLSGHCGRGQPALLFLRRNEDDARG